MVATACTAYREAARATGCPKVRLGTAGSHDRAVSASAGTMFVPRKPPCLLHYRLRISFEEIPRCTDSSTGGRQLTRGALACGLASLTALAATPTAWAQSAPPDADTRAGTIVAQEQQKATQLKPYEPSKAEKYVKKLEEQFLTGSLHWHPFFTSAYAGGGFTLGAGYLTHVGSYNTIDFRGSWTPSGTCGRSPSSSRLACSTVAASCRWSAAGARPLRWASTATAPARPRLTIVPTTASPSPTGPRS